MWIIQYTPYMKKFTDQNNRVSNWYKTESKPQFFYPLNYNSGFALFYSLIESLAEGDVRLGLGALHELLDLEGAGTRGLATARGRCCSWRRSGGDGSWSRGAAAAGEHTGHAGADHVANRRAHRYTARCGCHLNKDKLSICCNFFWIYIPLARLYIIKPYNMDFFTKV